MRSLAWWEQGGWWLDVLKMATVSRIEFQEWQVLDSYSNFFLGIAIFVGLEKTDVYKILS